MSTRIVLALSGWKGSGKDTAADYLVREHGFIRASFADSLKEMVAQQYNIPLNWMHDPTLKEVPVREYPVISGDPFAEQIHQMLGAELKSGYWTPRALCILEGSVKRSVHSNYWVRTIINRITDDSTGNYVISDMRYTTEADTLKFILPDAVTVRVVRRDDVDTQDPSERNLDSYRFQYRLDNRGSLESLHNNVDDLIEQLQRED